MSIHKYRRNERCWCNSGRKYKHCHLGREEQPRVPVSDVLKNQRDAWDSKYCLHPEKSRCTGNIVQAHTVQRNGGLTKIADKGHVYGFRGNSVMDLERDKGFIAPKLVGVGKASTFTGFCGHHDDSVFAPIEKHSFLAQQDHAFLFAYRHLCMELFTKQAAVKAGAMLRQLDRGRPVDFQRNLQQFSDTFLDGQAVGLNWTKQIKAAFDKVIVSGDFSSVRYYILRFPETPEIQVCSGQFPQLDFDANRLQSLEDEHRLPDHMGFNIVATSTGGAAVFVWLGANPSAEAFVKSLHNKADADIPDALVRYTFEFFENSFFSPAWWNGLGDFVQGAIRLRVTESGSPWIARRQDCLKYDGNKYVNWTVAARETNLAL